MNDNTENLKQTPLRNSNLANKPFRSPFSNNSTPSKNNLKRQCPSSFTCLQTTSPKVQLQEQEKVIKRRRLDVESYEPENNSRPTRNDLLMLKQRIRRKKLEIDSLKIKLAYRKKHNVEDLKIETKKWQIALQNALIQYQKDCKDTFVEESTLNMKGILFQLGIPESVVQFLDDVDNP